MKFFLSLLALGVATSASAISVNADSQTLPQSVLTRLGGAETFGPYEYVMEEEISLPDHTIYRPQNRTTKAAPMPVFIWANGGCGNAGNGFERYLAQFAANGYFVIANGPIHWSAAGRPSPEGVTMLWPPKDDKSLPAQSKTSQLYEAMDWVTKSLPAKYRGMIDVTRIAVGGQSCGGLQAIKAASDPRVKTAVIMNSGIVRGGIPGPNGTVRPVPDYLPADARDLANLHAPMIYIVGGPDDQAFQASSQDLNEIKTAQVWHASDKSGHNGTYWKPYGGEYAQVVLAWLNWKLSNKAEWSDYFDPVNCTLCNKKSWTLKKNK